MSATDFALGERVLASVGGSGMPKPGVVTATMNATHADWLWSGEMRYMVKFDGDHGPSGPCVAFRAEHGREDDSPADGLAA